MRRIAYWIINTALLFSLLFLVLKVASTFVTTNDVKDSDDKPYSLTISDTGGMGYRIGATILRPLLESRIDSYIREQGLMEYLESLKSHMMPKSSFSYSDVQEGTGPKAVCGQKVTATIISMEMSGKETDSTSYRKVVDGVSRSLSPVSFHLGAHNIPEINYALLGMQKGSSRVIIVNSEKFSGSHYVTLSSIDSSEPTDDMLERFLVFDKTRQDFKNKAVAIFRCGDKVSVMYNLRDSAGNLLVSNKAETFVIGKREVPIALDLAAVDLRSDSFRSVIVPPGLLNGFGNISDKKSVKIIDVWVDNPADISANSKSYS